MKIKIKDIVQMASLLIKITDYEGTAYGEDEVIELAEKIMNEASDRYEEGWHDALKAALEGAYETAYGDKEVHEDTIKALMLTHNGVTTNLEREVEI